MGSAWVGLIGTVVGVVVGGLLSWLIKRQEVQEQRAVRWDPDKRQAYQALLAAGDDYERAVYALQRAARDGNPLTEDALHAAYLRLQKATTELLFFAPVAVGNAAQAYVGTLVPPFGDLPRTGHGQGAYGWRTVDFDDHDRGEDLQTRRTNLVAAARRDLGLHAPITWASLPSEID